MNDYVKAFVILLLVILTTALVFGIVVGAFWLAMYHPLVFVGLFVGTFLICVYRTILADIRSS